MLMRPDAAIDYVDRQIGEQMDIKQELNIQDCPRPQDIDANCKEIAELIRLKDRIQILRDMAADNRKKKANG